MQFSSSSRVGLLQFYKAFAKLIWNIVLLTCKDKDGKFFIKHTKKSVLWYHQIIWVEVLRPLWSWGGGIPRYRLQQNTVLESLLQCLDLNEQRTEERQSGPGWCRAKHEDQGLRHGRIPAWEFWYDTLWIQCCYSVYYSLLQSLWFSSNACFINYMMYENTTLFLMVASVWHVQLIIRAYFEGK